MYKIITLILGLMASLSLFAQQEAAQYSFEPNDPNTSLWYGYGDGNYLVALDKDVYHDGATSVRIESKPDSKQFQPLTFSIPANFGGSKIQLSGWMKSENISGGYASFWLRIDPDVGFTNMGSKVLSGTSDWTKYTLELDLKPGEAKKIVFGALLSGQGKVWVDDITLTVDGQPLDKAPPVQLTKAQKDTAFDQGSGFEIENPTTQQLENLALLGRVWGFLKYHHPAIAKGDYNWDYELFRHMQEIAFAKADTTRDQLLLKWIESLGPLQDCNSCKPTPASAVLKPDHQWFTKGAISEDLAQKLQEVYQKRTQGNHYYIETAINVGNPVFKNEKSYGDMPYPDTGFRLLGLFRYWNIIQYYFPYKDITDNDWNTVLTSYLPIFINAQDELAYEKANLRLIGEVQDTHANVWGGADKFQATLGRKYPPIRAAFVENELVVVDYYNPEMKATVGLELGDVITHINNKTVKDIVRERMPFYPASNEAARARDIAENILRSDREIIELKIIRDKQKMSKNISMYLQDELDYYRWYRRESEAPSFKMLPGNIGYITLANISRDDPEKIKKAFANCKGIIIDIRNYPSAFMPFALGQFIAPRNTEFVKFTTVDPSNPGAFIMGKPLATGAGNKAEFQGKVVVLVNELSQSQAEYTAMAFRAAPNTTIIGSTTAGADGNVSRFNLPGGLRTMISGIGVFYPDGSPTQRVGIVPDLEVTPTIQGIKEGRDELLESAISVIEKVKQ
ncbi:MAG: peptidase S41 [Cytophagaceae bacterium]|nr:peptidase S41 [Cytophagaceae bacterium]